MISPEREQPLSHRIHVASQSIADRLDLERKVLAAAFKICFDSGDSDGAAKAHKGLCAIIQEQLFAGESNSSSGGSVIPASFWKQQQSSDDVEQEPCPEPSADNSLQHHTLQGELSPEPSPAPPPSLFELQAVEPASIECAASTSDLGLPPQAPGTTASAPEPASIETSCGPSQGLTSQAPGTTVWEPAPEASLINSNAIPLPALTSEPEPLDPLGQADPTAPLSYLDLGDEDNLPPPDPPSPAPTEAVLAPVSPSQLIKTQTFYQILGVNQVASFEEIHTKYLRLMRRLARSRYSAANCITDMREFREVLRAVCVAHDVLKDPVTRADYDLRQIGMRSEGGNETSESGMPAPRARLMIGELLECAQILEPAELQIALDMHKAEPGTQFGEFLVGAHFLTQEELDCALLAQRLIDSGKITVNQFRTGMYRMRDEGTAFFDTLLIEGWLSAADIFDDTSAIWRNGDTPAVSTPAPPAVSHAATQQFSEPEPTRMEPPAVVLATKADLQQVWGETDALAETQSLEVSAFRAAVEMRSEENTD